jgi:hypothetical protein
MTQDLHNRLQFGAPFRQLEIAAVVRRYAEAGYVVYVAPPGQLCAACQPELLPTSTLCQRWRDRKAR